MVKIIFHGSLKNICPDVYEVDASTPSEAIRGLTNQFRDKLIRKDGSRFSCSVKECKTDFQLNSKLATEELNIYPAFLASGGGKNANVFNMVVGAVLIVLGAVSYFYGGWTGFGQFLMLTGASMMISGVVGSLWKMDTAKDEQNPESSKAFGNKGNTTKIGTRIAIGYGTYRVAGQYLSINTEAVDMLSDSITVKRSFFHKILYGDQVIYKSGVE